MEDAMIAYTTLFNAADFTYQDASEKYEYNFMQVPFVSFFFGGGSLTSFIVNYYWVMLVGKSLGNLDESGRGLA